MKRETKKTQLSVLVVLTLLSSCYYENNKPFDSVEWNKEGVDWWITDVREKMVKDIIQSDTLIGLQKDEVIKLLGRPEKIDSNKLYIFVREKYSTNIDPDYIKYLIVELDKNENVFKVSEYRTK